MSAILGRRLGQLGVWIRIFIVGFLLLILLLDAYAFYRIHVARLGNALDYYPFWAGGREVVLRQGSPYTPEVTLSIQRAIYGRPALPSENQHGYAYPAYASLLTVPFLYLPFPISASLWIAFQQFLIIAAVVLTVQATGWQPRPWALLLICLAAIVFRYSMITLVLGQTSIWVLFWLALALWFAQRRNDLGAGLSLAAASIKPQLVILPALALLTSLPRQQRKRAGIAATGALVTLVICSFLLAGLWLWDYLQQLQAYQTYSSTQFPIAALFRIWLPGGATQWLNLVAISILLGFFAYVVWAWRGSGQPALPVAVAVVVTQLVMPQTGSYNLVLLLLSAVVALGVLSANRDPGSWLPSAGKALAWSDLIIVPWFFWAIFQEPAQGAWDLVFVPGILAIVMLGLVLRHRRDLE